MKHLNIPLPDELHKELRLAAVELDTSVAHILRGLVVAFLEEQKADKVGSMTTKSLITSGLLSRGIPVVRSGKPFPSDADVDRELLGAIKND